MSGIVDCEIHIGDEVFVHGYIDEIRNDTIIIRNVGGYFGTSRDEVFYYEEDGSMTEAEQTEPSLEQFRVGLEYHTDAMHFGKAKGESITTDKTEQTEPQNVIGEHFPSYITEDRTTQVLDGWQANPRTSTTAIEDEPQTERESE